MKPSLQTFADVVARDGPHDLARACLLIAQDAYPDLDVERYMREIETLGLRLRARVKGIGAAVTGESAPEEQLVGLNEFIFEELGYWGNVEEYYDPRNSYLNDVIERKTGIPITLSILYMELGRRIGLPLEGISFPGHFLVRLQTRSSVLILDPFVGGVRQSESDLRERLQRVIPEGAAPDVSVAELPMDQFLEPASTRQILARVLRNLKGIYRETDQPERLLEVLNRMLVVSPDAAAELRDRGFVYQRLECWRPALKDLTDYLDRDPEAPDIHEVRTALVDLSARCARLN
jgi:regulator of sirC expression with transglutaminase-like and TPR domain